VSASLTHLQALRAWFAQNMAAIFREALAIDEPAGHSPAWQQACAYHQVPLMSDEEREQVRRLQKPIRGAAVMELSQMVSSVVRQARSSLHAVPNDGSQEAETALDQLRQLLDRSEQQSVDAYKRAVLPKRKGMFGNVLAHHDDDAPAAMATPSTHTLCCRTCGAPRLNDQDFNCPFCGNHMASPS
jgi:rubrerythrin